MPSADDRSLGERAFGDLLDQGHAMRPDQVAPAARETARRLGAADLTVLLVDRDQRVLVDIDDPSSTVDIDGSLAGRVFRTRTEQETEDALWVPLLDGADRVGVLHVVLTEPTTEVFRARMRHLSSIVALLIVTKSHFGDVIEIARRTRPMQMAAELRWALLPPLTFRNDHVEIAAMLEPVYEVAGDAFDYAVGPDVVHVGVFDAMGHGLEATRMANLAIAAYRNGRRGGASLIDVAHTIDEVIFDQFGPDRFVTALLLTLDLRTGFVQLVVAGHPRPLLLRGTNVVGQVDAQVTVPMGLGVQPIENEIRLEVGDRLLLFTDGVVEARADDGAEFGIDTVSELLSHATMAAEIPSETARRLAHSVLAHAVRLHDDATMVLLGWPRAKAS